MTNQAIYNRIEKNEAAITRLSNRANGLARHDPRQYGIWLKIRGFQSEITIYQELANQQTHHRAPVNRG